LAVKAERLFVFCYFPSIISLAASSLLIGALLNVKAVLPESAAD
jgi:hypothetical protein